ncbi:MAG: winged helix-turn-helix transcriptional regulator [Gemmatimonadaceae bacterium]|nr:winged helix-turn-helix transcriptional regulator [Gemmatimonadaceae bacterium]
MATQAICDQPPPTMSTAPTHEQYSCRILETFESDRGASQRSLAVELGIALGLTNLLVKRLVRKGWVRVVQIKPNRVRYLITPAGVAEKSRMSRAYFETSVQFYRQTRDRIQQQFFVLSRGWPDDGTPGLRKRIVFYGAGEVSEIGHICLVETDLELIGVVDVAATKPFFGLRVCSPEHVDGLLLNGQAFDRLVVMSFGNPDELRTGILALRIPADRVFWL